MASMTQIQASAGSGKTHEITSRFLTLLATAKPRLSGACSHHQEGEYAWSEIMAITFTNKAATEMRDRIMHRLKLHALGTATDIPKLSPSLAKIWVNTILRSYSTLNVRTIDSLLHSIVRLSALELGLSPDFELSFDWKEALNPLIDEILEGSRTDPTLKAHLDEACTYLYNHTPLTGFTAPRNLRDNIIKMYHALALVPRDALATRADILQLLMGLHTQMRTCAAMFADIAEKEHLSPTNYMVKALADCAQNTWQDKVPSSKLLRKETALEVVKGTPELSEAAKNTYEALRQSIQELDEKAPILKGALAFLPYLNLAEHVAENMVDFITRHHCISSDLVPRLAHRVLTTDYGIATISCRLGSQMQHVLIDEFQDTSFEQWEALFPIVEEALRHTGSFTWVGDTKQAVYGWRGGDARLFDAILNDQRLRSLVREPEQIPLATNWRTQQNIVDYNNTIFSQLSDKTTARAVLSALSPSETPSHHLDESAAYLGQVFNHAEQKNLPEKTEGYLYIQRLITEKKEERDEAVRLATLARLRAIRTRRPYKDIAILVRKNSEAACLAAWLMEEDIPVITEHSLYIHEHPLIASLTALLAFIDNPLDECALWHCASDMYFLQGEHRPKREDVEIWAATRSTTTPMYQSFCEHFPKAWEHLFAPFMLASGPYASLLGPYNATAEAIDYFKLMERFPEHAAFLRHFLEILYMTEKQGHLSIKSFLDYWEEHGTNEKAPMPESLDAVQIITIHKAKGLEFPVVIVPWHDNTPLNNTPLVVKELDGLTLICPATKHIPEHFYTSRLQAVQESLQVLYVAWTRPKEELHLLLTETKYSRSKGGLINAIDILVENLHFDENAIYTHGAVPKGRTEKLQENIPPQLASVATSPLPWHPLEWLPNLRVWRSPIGDLRDNAKRRGVFIHHCLSCLKPTGSPKDDALQAFEVGLASFPLPLHNTETIRQESLDCLRWVASLPEASTWFANGQSEQACLGSDGKLWRPDLIITDPQTRLPTDVIEYKTGQPHAAHTKQITTYKTLLEAITKKPVRGMILYVDEQKMLAI